MSLAESFGAWFWTNTIDWPDNFAIEQPGRGRDLFTFLARAVLEVAEFGEPQQTSGMRLEWAARRIVARCVHGSIRTLLCRKVGGEVIGEFGAAEWGTIERLDELERVFTECSVVAAGGEKCRLFVSRFGILQLTTTIKSATPIAPTIPEPAGVPIGSHSLCAYVCLPEVTQKATTRIRGRGDVATEKAIRREIAAILGEMGYGVDVPGKPVPDRIHLGWLTLGAKRRGAGFKTREVWDGQVD